MIKKRVMFLFWLVLVIMFFQHCMAQSRDELPQDMPEDFKVDFFHDSGMMRQCRKAFISKDSCFFSFKVGKNEEKFNFEISETELGNLYSAFRKNKFSQIKENREREVYDRGGTIIKIMWKDKVLTKDNSGMTFIKESWKINFFNVYEAIKSLVKNKLKDKINWD